MNLFFKLFVGGFLLGCGLWAQELTETPPPGYIKTIVCKGKNQGDQFPVVKLGEPVFLWFDDIQAGEADYYYKIVHCDYNWAPSALLPAQYLKGLNNQRITSYRNSTNTLQPYSHYELQIPNSQTQLTLSGNYLLEILDSRDNLVFSRRFVVYEDRVQVGVTLKRSRNLASIREKQVVQFVLNTNGMALVNPQQEVKVAVLQNYRWKSALTGLRPQFFSGNQLIYRYDVETAFDGGNEFLFFDTKEIRTANNTIASVQLQDHYHHYLFPHRSRAGQPYTYYPDLNGDFAVRSLNGNDDSTQADYSWVHVSLPYQNTTGLQQVYVVGRFNNYERTGENRLTFNERSGNWEGALFLKQGFYNYKYVLVREEGVVDENGVDGNFFETENQYLVLVYYRDFGGLYDRLIGIGSANSTAISN